MTTQSACLDDAPGGDDGDDGVNNTFDLCPYLPDTPRNLLLFNNNSTNPLEHLELKITRGRMLRGVVDGSGAAVSAFAAAPLAGRWGWLLQGREGWCYGVHPNRSMLSTLGPEGEIPPPSGPLVGIKVSCSGPRSRRICHTCKHRLQATTIAHSRPDR